MPRKLTVRTPGAAVVAPERQAPTPPNVPESFLAEIAALSDEGLISLDTAERAGENRPEYLDAIDAELKPRIAKMAGQVAVSAELTASELEQVKASKPGGVLHVEPERVRPLGLPTPADVNPGQITTSVLTTEGWVVPSTSTPPPIR